MANLKRKKSRDTSREKTSSTIDIFIPDNHPVKMAFTSNPKQTGGEVGYSN